MPCKSIVTLLLFLSCMLPISMYAQEIEVELIEEIKLDADRFVGADEHGSLYYLKNEVLHKKKGSRSFSFASPEHGPLTDVIIQNPFKLLLFYREFNTVIFLDNNLNPLSSPIDLTPESRLYNVTHVSGSSENNIWLFADDNKLHLLNYQNRSELIETQPMSFYDEEFRAIGLFSTFKKVWILSQTDLYEFNEYGNFLVQEEASGVNRVFPLPRGQVWLYKNKLVFREDGKNRPIQIELPETEFEIHLTGSMLYLYEGKQLRKYTFKP